jgi:sensor domain CHASE-containing protein
VTEKSAVQKKSNMLPFIIATVVLIVAIIIVFFATRGETEGFYLPVAETDTPNIATLAEELSEPEPS